MDTIAAPATSGAGAIAIVRMSGSQSREVISRVFDSHEKLSHAKMVHGRIKDVGRVIDEVMTVFFAAPHSYTGEDTVEIYCHANPFGVYDIVCCLTKNGARAAQPGEFTRRAFLNGRIDLTQAEAVCDFIAATSAAGARAAQSQLQGKLKQTVLSLQDRLSDLIAEAQAAVEYPEEDLEFLVLRRAAPHLRELIASVQSLARTYETGRVIKEGLQVTIAGKPNVGKSTVFNALAGRERVIVSPASGTTRDTVEFPISLNGIAVLLTDTAGIRNTEDEVEAEGVRRTREALEEAQLTVFVTDASLPLTQEDVRAFAAVSGKVLAVLNKTDLPCAVTQADIQRQFGSIPVLSVSAKTGEGIDALRGAMHDFALRDAPAGEGALITNVRHRDLLWQAAASLKEALRSLQGGADMDCLVIDLNMAWTWLGEITGNTVTEEIIDRIFSKFCLGK